ncbi:MAG: creatininase family protein [Patescibacteria group bacterium]
MLWEELTAAEFAGAAASTRGTCLVPLGVLEKHGDHLPLGTDLLNVRALAIRAAAIEPAIVFPPYYFGQICEARHQPGTLAFGEELLLGALRGVCAEIARNGLKKIILVNGHGGNCHMLHYFAQMMLDETRDYVVYLADLDAVRPPEALALIENKDGGHADEGETSVMLAHRPDLVKLDRADVEDGRPRLRLRNLRGAYTGIWWYADYPGQQAGDPTRATAEKGRRMLELGAASLAKLIAAVKEDTVAAELQEEFYRRALEPLGQAKDRRF